MNQPLAPESNAPSTRPYLIRAIHAWCSDHGFTPYLAVWVDDGVQVPREFVRNNEIVLNVSLDATSGLNLGDEYVEFKARFGGVPRDIFVPVANVLAIYARENGQGMAFPAPGPFPSVEASEGDTPSPPSGLQLAPVKTAEAPTPPSGSPRPTLKRIK